MLTTTQGQALYASLGKGLYRSKDGFVMKRELTTATPNGNPMAGRWALRDPSGQLLDFDCYRHDLAERHGITLCGEGAL